MVRPTPALNPTSTGSDMKLPTTPSRSIAATNKMPPTKQDNVPVVASNSSSEPLGATCRSAAAVRIAIVEVVVTLNGREVPMTAYTTNGTKAVYRPTTSGSPAIAA